jgi:hypothetical protein
MRGFRSPASVCLAFICLALAAGTAPASAFRTPQTNVPPPTQHELDVRFADNRSQPYAMNYADEAAQSLGIRDGKWEAFSTHSSDPLVPSLKGGIDSGGPMLRLQWRQ